VSGRSEKLLALVAFLVLTGLLGTYHAVNAFNHNLDTAFLLEAMRHVRETGVPTTFLGPAFLDALEGLYFDASTFCNAAMKASEKGLSIMTSHAYLMIYPLGWLGWLAPDHVVLGLVNGLAYAGFVYILYGVLRRHGVGVTGALAFCAVAIAHPVWTFGQMGDFYLDRFFSPLGLLYAALLHALVSGRQAPTPRALALLLAVVLLAVSTTERAAVMVGYMSAVFLAAYWRQAPRELKLLVPMLCVVLGTYVLVWMLTVYVPHDATPTHGRFLQRLLHELGKFNDPVMGPKIAEFLWVNLVLLAIWAGADWRLALIAAAAVFPNLAVSMGGAEKTGWSTHYHSLYFPFVVFAGAAGLGKVWSRLVGTRWRFAVAVAVAALVPLIGQAAAAYRGQPGIGLRAYLFYTQGKDSYERYRAEQLRKVAEAVPKGSRVAALEQFTPILQDGRKVSYYPVGLAEADYAVLARVDKPDGSFTYVGAVSYVGAGAEADACLTQRMGRMGFDTDKPKMQMGAVVVLARKPR
jgi:hypothetical protein